jgi:hypothetical protein
LCQNGSLSVSSSIRETEKSRVVGKQQSCCFWSKILWWKRNCETVRCHNATAISFIAKLWGEIFTHIHAFAIKHHSIMQDWLFESHDEFFVNNSLEVKENDGHALDFALHLSCLFSFSVSVSLDFLCTTRAFFPKRLSNHC